MINELISPKTAINEHKIKTFIAAFETLVATLKELMSFESFRSPFI